MPVKKGTRDLAEERRSGIITRGLDDSARLSLNKHGDKKFQDSSGPRRQASGLDAPAMGDVSDLTEDDGTSSPTILHQADAIRFLERARARR